MSSTTEEKFNYSSHCILVVNRGEIALRIFRTAKSLGIRTISLYTNSDAHAPHVLFADDAIALPFPLESTTGASEASAYLSIEHIISIICEYNIDHGDNPITLVHPGYGFLSENATFASRVASMTGATWVGPSPEVIAEMGLKHVARQMAIRAGLPVVPGSEGLLSSEDSIEAFDTANRIGYPIILKATAGGGGMGMAICRDDQQLANELERTKDRAKVLFGEEGVFLEKYFPAARHIEIQVFGNGLGDVVHLAERECSIQRRHQKIIEETPSPFLQANEGLRERMCEAAVALCSALKYNSVGTVELIVDDQLGKFYFLEMNTRIQVEHPITEAIHPGLDLVKLMIQQAILERSSELGKGGFPADSLEMQQSFYDELRAKGCHDGSHGHAIEGRLYAENPVEGFAPSPGLLQYVNFPLNRNWIRVDSWISTGTTITSFFDPLLCKLIVVGKDREEARRRFIEALNMTTILGPPNNIEYLISIAESGFFTEGRTITTSLNEFSFTPRAFKILSAGMDMSIQDFPGRSIGLGIPRSGPMDELAFRAGNILVGNQQGTEGIEMVLLPRMPPVRIKFFSDAVISVTGANVEVVTNSELKSSWSRIAISQDTILSIKGLQTEDDKGAVGFRVYICIHGGLPDIPVYLGSKSTSVGLGGYQGRTLVSGDQLALQNPYQLTDVGKDIPISRVPSYPQAWIIYVLPGPCDTTEYVTAEGIEKFYNTTWIVSPSSNRMGIRLQSSDGSKIDWARENGGEGGSHPSNILDNAYAPATVNINGDTPVILTNEGPDMGGYLCLCTVASAEKWKLGQLSPGSVIQFSRISWLKARELRAGVEEYFTTLEKNSELTPRFPAEELSIPDTHYSPILHIKGAEEGQSIPGVVFRQAGDEAILVDFGVMSLDFFVRARIHAFQNAVLERSPPGLRLLCPCIRSIMCYFDFTKVTQKDFLNALVEIEGLVPNSNHDMTFPGRRLTLPIVLDDRWCREALQRYIQTTRDKAVYLPSNVQYLADNNGLGSPEEALEKLVQSDWLVFGVGFYLACPFLVPVDPRCRLEGQKMNPSRTFTPRGAIGIAGPVAAIYPIESPGGYQLYGRTLPLWQTWGRGENYRADKPWLLQSFDQIHFTRVTEEEYVRIEREFDAGLYKFQIEDAIFSLAQYASFLNSVECETSAFRHKKAQAKTVTEARERDLLSAWEKEKDQSENSQPTEIDDSFQIEFTIRAALFANVWKIKSEPGQLVTSADQILLILEAMKSEIMITAGEEFVGSIIQGHGKGIKEGAAVRPGDILVVFDRGCTANVAR